MARKKFKILMAVLTVKWLALMLVDWKYLIMISERVVEMN